MDYTKINNLITKGDNIIGVPLSTNDVGKIQNLMYIDNNDRIISKDDLILDDWTLGKVLKVMKDTGKSLGFMILDSKSFKSLDLLFEDVTDEKTGAHFFKEYISTKDQNELENRFSTVGKNWNNRKKELVSAVEEFNQEVFDNFSLSTIEEKNV